jgi:hypothetical protein
LARVPRYVVEGHVAEEPVAEGHVGDGGTHE